MSPTLLPSPGMGFSKSPGKKLIIKPFKESPALDPSTAKIGNREVHTTATISNPPAQALLMTQRDSEASPQSALLWFGHPSTSLTIIDQ